MPLAHILAPQLARKAEEIAQATGDGSPSYLRSQQDPRVGVFLDAFNQSKMPPATPAQAAEQSRQFYPPGDARYIPADAVPTPAQKAAPARPANVSTAKQTDARYEPPLADPKNLRGRYRQEPDKEFSGKYDPTSPAGSYLNAMGLMQRDDNSGVRAFANAAVDAAMPKNEPTPIPNYVPPAAPTPAPHARGRQVIQLEPDANGAVAYDEAGRGIDAQGRSMGFLRQAPGPGMITADRNFNTAVDTSKPTKDAFDVSQLEQNFGEHLRAMEDNRDRNGRPTDKFPDDYFKGMTAKEKKYITEGVKELRRVQKNTVMLNGTRVTKGAMI